MSESNDSLRPAARIFCIARNYAEHAKEMGNAIPSEPVIFMKPASSMVGVGEPLKVPKAQGLVHHEMELVVMLGRQGSEIPVQSAREHVAKVTLGIDLTLRDVQNRLKKAGHPWELCKSFDGSAVIGDFIEWPRQSDIQNIDMQCRVNGSLRQQGNTRDMLFPVAQIIAFLSRHWRLLPGDLIYTGTPAGVGPLIAGDRIEIESPQIGRFGWNVA
ncbi:MAG: fumarylacetoacetate hydrolase family protein [Gammaproteobacteria bacterium]|nr:fumarylacetoacetate hydrolase family protein [Gammaproteobacteria bacterium]MDE2345143.1 fumarylacetoacetate hydrolase family protein [Gammaproteobacteria bacterium]